jgi:polyphosphate kinase 2 (PPK2 family)
VGSKTRKKKHPAGRSVAEGSTSRIRTVVERIEPHSDAMPIVKQIQHVHDGMKKKDRNEVIDAALTKHFRSEMLKPYQAELIKLQQHLEKTNKKAIILFDGRDASGKGGTIRRVVRYMNE